MRQNLVKKLTHFSNQSIADIDLSTLDDQQLEFELETLRAEKRRLIALGMKIETEMIGIKEELRRRQEKSAGERSRKGLSKD